VSRQLLFTATLLGTLMGLLPGWTVWEANAHQFHQQNLAETARRVKVFEVQVARNPWDAGAYARLLNVYLNRARLSGDWGDIDKARTLAAKAEENNIESAEILWSETRLYAYQHQFRQALQAAERMLQLAPDDPRAYGACGDALLELGHLSQAQVQYAKMIHLRRDFDALVRLAKVLQLTGESQQADRLMHEAIELSSAESEASGRHAWAQVMLAGFALANGHIEAATEQVGKALLIDPDFDIALKSMGDLYVLQGNDQRADLLYGRAFSQRPDPVYAAAWAQVKRRLGQSALADTLDQVAERTLRAHVDAGRNAYLRELAFFYLTHQIKAQDALRFALGDAALRQDTTGLTILAWAYLQNGQHQQAWDTIQQATNRPDADASVFYRAGQIARALGDTASAKDYLHTALQSNSPLDRVSSEDARRWLETL
jgi:tetratricopeptide (TPR) repeat protein